MLQRTNDEWIEHLGAGGAQQDVALSDLREVLISRLRRSFRGRHGADENFLEDVAQDALLKTLDNLSKFEGRSRFASWATSIAVRTAFTKLRRRHWQDISLDQAVADDDRPAPEAVDSGLGPEVDLERKMLIEKMYQISETELTEKQRIALTAELKGMPQEEIGQRLGSNRNAVYKLTHDARKRLKKHLVDSGYNIQDIQASFAKV